jgi:AMIN domain
MAFNRVKQIGLGAGVILFLGAILFQFEQVPFDGVLYGAEPLTSDVAPLRYKIPSLPPPSKELPPTEVTDIQPMPEQQAVSNGNSLPSDPPVLAQPTPIVEDSVDKAPPPQSGAGDKQKGERKSGLGDKQKEERKSAMSALKPGSDSKSELLSPKASVISGSSKKILDIESDIKSTTAEMITIVLTGLFPPEAQVIEGKTPKIICDFPDVLMEKTIKRVIAINGRYIVQVRTGIHPPPEPKSRVVIDLAPNRDYEVEQLFYEQNNRYSMIIREKS